MRKLKSEEDEDKGDAGPALFFFLLCDYPLYWIDGVSEKWQVESLL